MLCLLVRLGHCCDGCVWTYVCFILGESGVSPLGGGELLGRTVLQRLNSPLAPL